MFCDTMSMRIIVDETIFPSNLTQITLPDCDDADYHVNGNVVVANFGRCASNVAQNNDIIVMVGHSS